MKRAPIPELSVLIPTITEREQEANALFRSLEGRVKGRSVELLMMRDNCFSGIGEARNKLLRAAGGNTSLSWMMMMRFARAILS